MRRVVTKRATKTGKVHRRDMANVKRGNLAAPPQWWKHLRDWRRVFWKRERREQVREIKREAR